MNKYEEYGKIYKLECNETDMIYYGSTCQRYLCNRKTTHLSNYKDFLTGKFKHNLTAFQILKNMNFKMTLVENYPCKSREELEYRERYYIENFECINTSIPRKTVEEQKETKKAYDLKHKKYFADLGKERYKNDKEYSDKIRERTRIRRAENIDTIRIENIRYNRYKRTWGGDKRNNNNLLEISLDIF